MRRSLALGVAIVLAAVLLPSASRPASGAQIELPSHGVARLETVPTVAISAIAVGSRHTCALTQEGGVKCWGENTSGQLGDGTTTNSGTPVDVVGLASGVMAIDAGQVNTCALTRSGGVKCWGYNGGGELGNGKNTDSSDPVDVVGLTSGVAAIAAGWLHTCALTGGGGVKCWGNDGSRPPGGTRSPVDVFGLTSGVRAISAGYYYTCAVTTAGGMKCRGLNEHGQLGNGTTTPSSIPIDVVGLTNGVTKIAAGMQHTCALAGGSGVMCWGHNHVGQLGNGAIPYSAMSDATARSLIPVGVLGLETGATGIAVGGEHTCAITSGGGVGCWGGNQRGQLGDGTRLASGVPVVVAGLTSGVGAVAAGWGDHTCALTSSGGVACWGDNTSGQLGNGTTSPSSVPVNVDLTIRPTIVLRSSRPAGTIAAGTAVTFSATVNPLRPAGEQATVRFEIYRQDDAGWRLAARRDVAADATGRATLRWTFVTVGSRSVRAKALESTRQVASTWSPSILHTVVAFGPVPLITAIAAGDGHTCALGGDRVRCWGTNGAGQLGNGTTTSSTVPADVLNLSGEVAAIAVGGHTCALSRGGGVTCWGHNADGRLGNGTLLDSSVPVDVSGLASGVAAVDVGNTHSCALMAEGGVKCWGRNDFGQLGNGTTSVSLAPVDVLGLASGVSAISAGGGHTCALTRSGGVKCWGSNYAGQLGNGTTTDTSAPVDVSGLSRGIVAITAGIYHSCALSNVGGVMCWGAIASRQLPDGGLQSTFALSPLQVLGLTSGVASISAGGNQTCAVTSGGGALCWGDNRYGQLGNGTTTLSRSPVAVAGLTSGVSAISTAWSHACALTPSGGVRCWGSNDAGVLGDGTTRDSSTPVDVLGLSLRRPDGRVRVGAGVFVGNNIYNATGSGQTQTGSSARGGTITFGISIQNDGNLGESFRVKASGSASSAYTVKYFRGSTDITASIVAGTYRTPSVAPAANHLITARVTVRPSAAAGSSATQLVTITSGGDATKKDTIKFIGRRA